MEKQTQIYILMAVFLLSGVSGAKIMFIPGNANSHVLYFTRLADALSYVGHSTDVFVPSNAHKVQLDANISKVTTISYPVSGEQPYLNSPEASELMVQIAVSKSWIERVKLFYKFGMALMENVEHDCVRFMENKELQKRIRDEKYDFAVMDGLAMQCYHVLPYSLGIPYATLSVTSAGWIYRIPAMPSFLSTLGYTDRMSFTERLITLLAEVGQLAAVGYNTTYCQRYAPEKETQDMIQLFVRSSLWILIEDLSLGYPRPHMPNTVGIGDLMAGQPVSALPADLQQFISGSTDGVIIVSFGSFFDYVPREVAEKFCRVFRSLKYRIIWKLKLEEYCPSAGNLKVVPWMPQNDLLAKKEIKLFISHAGLNSMAEALFFSKPLILFPIALDQPMNAAAAEAKGYAIRMDLSDFTESELSENIQKILTDPRYLYAAKRNAAIFRHKPLTPGQRVSYLINHILRFGDSHLRTGAYELNFFQYFMGDLFLFLFTVALIIVIVLFLCIRCTCKCVYNRCFSRKKVTAEKKNK